jgi:predicted nucleic acid-binding protein
LKVVLDSNVVLSGYLNQPVCADPDDDKFPACALASGIRLIVSGDEDLLAMNG